MTIDELYGKVSLAIFEAERLPDQRSREARDAFAEVSSLEEQIAGRLPVDDFEGMIARRGAVRAAVAAGEMERARRLTERYCAEPHANDGFRRSLNEMLLPKPVADVAAPISVEMSNENKVVVVDEPRNTPKVNEENSRMDHEKLRRECLESVKAVLSMLGGGGVGVRGAYRECLEQYLDEFPAEAGRGNMLLADCEARVLRGLFEEDHRVLPSALAEGLHRFFVVHRSICVFYDGVRRFYEEFSAGTRSGTLREVDVGDFLDDVERSPAFFDAKVSREFRDIDRELKRQEAVAVRLEAQSIVVPADPIAPRPLRARDFGVAGAMNAIYSTVLIGAESTGTVRGWGDLAQKLAAHAGSAIDLLREASREGQLARH